MSDEQPTIRRADSLPPLESVPSPTHHTAPPPPASDSIESTSASVPALHNELPRSFSGDILHTLEGLGVSAYSTASVEQTVIARALQVEEEAQARQQAKQAALHARSGRTVDKQSSQQRARIPRKIGTSIAAAQLPHSALQPPARVVHEDDPVTAAGTVSRQRLEDALAIQRRDKPRPAPPTAASSSSRGKTDGERREQGSTEAEDAAPTVRTAKQRMVDQGEMTPFHSMPGVEKDFRRVSRAELPTPASAAAAPRPRAAAPPPVRTSLPAQQSSKRKAAASRSKAPARSSTPTLKPPAASKQSRRSVTPPPGSPESTSPVSSVGSVASEWSVGELPRRLTRARMKQEENSMEEAMRRSEREASGVKREEKEAEDDDVQLIEMDSVKEEEEEDEGKQVKEERDDGEWKGDAESSPSEAEEADDYEDDEAARPSKRARGSNARRGGARRRLMRGADVEAEEVAEVEEEHVLDDDNDDDTADAYSGKGASRRGAVVVDDFFDWQYEERVAAYRHSTQFVNEVRRVEGRPQESKEEESEESSLDVAFDGGYLLPGRIWDRLFGYQKTSVKWMWELHCQNVGGIIADEMGLGKTIQMVAFLAGLHYSHAIHRAKQGSSAPSPFQLPPTLILAPATIISQWLREFHIWYPELRVLVLHDSVQSHHGQSKETVVAKLFQSAHVCITTYECCRLYQHLLLGREWGYVRHHFAHTNVDVCCCCCSLSTRLD